MRTKPSVGPRWRVSVFPPGVTELVPGSCPLVHKASRKQEIAQKHYDWYAAQVGDGKIGRVVMHQGNLSRGSSQYIHLDTAWGLCAARGDHRLRLLAGEPKEKAMQVEPEKETS